MNLLPQARWLDPECRRVAVYVSRRPSDEDNFTEIRIRSQRTGGVLRTSKDVAQGSVSNAEAVLTLCFAATPGDWPLCIEGRSETNEWRALHALEQGGTVPFHAPILMPGWSTANPPAADIRAVAAAMPSAVEKLAFACSFAQADAHTVLSLLESVRNQFHPQWVLYVFCADSLSRESTWHIEAYAQKDSRIRKVSLAHAADAPLAHSELLAIAAASWVCPLVSLRPLHPCFASGLVILTGRSRCEPYLGPQEQRHLDQLPSPFHRALAGKESTALQILPSFACQRTFLAHVADLLPSGFTEIALPGGKPTPGARAEPPPFPVHFHLDEPTTSSSIRFPASIRGWCCRVDLQPLSGIRLRHGTTILEATMGYPRPDVALAFGDSGSLASSGFTFPPLTEFTPDDLQVQFEIRADQRWYGVHSFELPPELAAAVRLFNRARSVYGRSRAARLLASYQSTNAGPQVTHDTDTIDVIVPAYLGYQDTRRCIDSLLSSANKVGIEIVVVNDASPDERLTAYLAGEATSDRITLISNPENVGFVASVNVALALHRGRDVVLLNSDTEVSGDWLDRLRAAAYSDELIATVSPMTNNGTICSYPRFCQSNELPVGHSLAEVDHAFSSATAPLISVPTTVGFCMFVKRSVVERTGEFDAATFGLGYGEENDFCLRAAASGFRHVVCPSVFVYHKGSVSFLHSRDARCRQALNSLERSFPAYSLEIQAFVQADPLRLLRARVQLDLLARRCGPAILFLTHNWGGGVERHIRDLASLLCGQVQVLVLRPSSVTAGFSLASLTEPQALHIDGVDFANMVRLLRGFPLVRLHIHHLVTVENEALVLPERLGLPYDITVHDYYAYCPQINLVDHHRHYCGEPAIEVCNECLQRRPRSGVTDVAAWRTRNNGLFERAVRVFVPTPSTAERISGHFPRCNIVVAPHPDAEWSHLHRAPNWTYDSGPLRVAIIGTMNLFKGSRLIAQTVEHAERHELPLQFHLLGEDQALLLRNGPRLTVSGGYLEAELPHLLERLRPHVVWFASLTPETYSYTLSAAMIESLPIVATDLGAFRDRLQGRPLTWLLPWTTPPRKWCDLFMLLRTTRPPVARSGSAPRELRPQAFDYRSDYLPPVAPVVRDIRTPNRLTVAALVSQSPDGVADACAHIRLIRPLTHPRVAPHIAFRRLTTHEAFCVRPDVLVVQRTAITDPDFAQRLVQHCRREAIKLVYEIDDALFELPPDHPEFKHYRRHRPAIEALMRESDQVVTSSERLAQRIRPFNPRVAVLPNALDENLLPLPTPTPESGRAEDGVFRILYMGTTTHQPDLALLEPAFAKLRADYGAAITLEVIGVASSESGWFQFVPVPADVARHYPEFISWLHRRNHWDLAIAPLTDSAFNQAKSSIKYLDYAALQLAVIASDVAPYQTVIDNGRNGLLVSNHPDDWHRAIRLLINLPPYRKSLARAAHRQFLERHTLEASASSVRRCWEQIASRRVAPAPPDGSSPTGVQAILHTTRDAR